MHALDLDKSLRVGQRLSVVFFFVTTSVTQACLWDWDALLCELRFVQQSARSNPLATPRSRSGDQLRAVEAGRDG
jgi:hypothetical protein